MWKLPTKLARFEDRNPNCPACGKPMIGDLIPKDRQHLHGSVFNLGKQILHQTPAAPSRERNYRFTFERAFKGDGG